MPKSFRAALSAAAFAATLLTPLAAQAGGHSEGRAHALSGFYGSVFVGANIPSEANFDGVIGGNPQSVDVEYDTGYAIGATLGRSWGTFGAIRPRTEIELSYRESDVDTIFFSGNGPAEEINVAGDSSSTTIFVNALADFPLQGAPVTPYIGIGAGVAFTKQDFVYGPGVRVGDSDEVFALQGIVGISYDLNDRVALTLDGRYQRAFGVESRRVAPNGTVTGIVEDDLDTFAITAGVRLKF